MVTQLGVRLKFLMLLKHDNILIFEVYNDSRFERLKQSSMRSSLHFQILIYLSWWILLIGIIYLHHFVKKSKQIVWKFNMNEVGEIYQRPWGAYQTLAMGSGFQIKILTINPGGQLSLQRHFQRAEHWVVVKGLPTITIDDMQKEYCVNSAVYIPIEAKHRIQNFTPAICQLVEVQIGDYLGEDDIERLDDVYGRAKVAWTF